jgi:hypothetical protein
MMSLCCLCAAFVLCDGGSLALNNANMESLAICWEAHVNVLPLRAVATIALNSEPLRCMLLLHTYAGMMTGQVGW